MTNFRHLNLRYNPEEDRICLQMRDLNDGEHRLWLTRRLVKLLLPALAEVLASDSAHATRAAAEWRNEILSFEHEKAVREVPTRRSVRRVTSPEPAGAGAAPVLAKMVSIHPKARDSRKVTFRTAETAVEVEVDDERLHVICELLIKLVRQAEWNLDFDLPWAAKRGSATAGAPDIKLS